MPCLAGQRPEATAILHVDRERMTAITVINHTAGGNSIAMHNDGMVAPTSQQAREASQAIIDARYAVMLAYIGHNFGLAA